MSFTFDRFGNPEATTTGFAPFREFQTWYRVTGSLDADTAPLIVIHGGPGASHDYVSPISQLALTGRPIVHYDQVGCGHSTALSDEVVRTLTVDFFIDELVNLLEHLGIGDNYCLLGHSWGGMLAQDFAARQPEGLTALVLSSSLASAAAWGAEVQRLASQLPDGFGEIYQRSLAGEDIGPELYRDLDDAFTYHHVFHGAPNWEHSGSVFPNNVYYTLWGRSEFDFDGLLSTWSAVDRLADITAPTLVIWGSDDESTALVNAEILEGIAHARAVEVDGGAHVTWVDAPEAYFAAVTEFLDDVDPQD